MMSAGGRRRGGCTARQESDHAASLVLLSIMVMVLVGGLTLPAHPVAIAQEATPAATPASGSAGALDLAAMAPVAEDLPAGFGRGYGGSYIPGSLFGDVYASEIDPAALAATGLQRSFEDYYGTFDAPITIGIFIDEYATAEGAAAGFALFEDETVASPDFTILSTTDLPGPDVGEEPKEISVTTSLYPDGMTVQEVAATFRIGNLNAGVWEERYTFPDESGTPVAAVATPSTPDPEQLQHVQDLAVTLAARIDAVRAGETPPGIDPMLAARVLPLGQVPDIALGQTWEGYRDGPVVLGYEGPLAPLASDVLGGYGRSISLGVGPETPPPYIGITVSELTCPRRRWRCWMPSGRRREICRHRATSPAAAPATCCRILRSLGRIRPWHSVRHWMKKIRMPRPTVCAWCLWPDPCSPPWTSRGLTRWRRPWPRPKPSPRSRRPVSWRRVPARR